MPKTRYDLAATVGTTKTRVRSHIQLSHTAFALLSQLTDLMRDISSNEERLRAPRDNHLTSCIAWAQFSTAGRELIDAVSEHNRYAKPGEQKDPMKEIQSAYQQVLLDRYTPGACSERLQTKYSAIHTAGAVVSMLLERQGKALVAELQERNERSADALRRLAPIQPKAPSRRVA